jgi:copper chaperone CopZ
MKILHKFSAMLLLFIFVVFQGCGNKGRKEGSGGFNVADSKIEVTISGMTCTGCEETITGSVSKLEGVSAVKADYKAGRAVVDFNSSLADTSEIRAAITHSGYKVTGFRQISAADSVI